MTMTVIRLLICISHEVRTPRKKWRRATRYMIWVRRLLPKRDSATRRLPGARVACLHNKKVQQCMRAYKKKKTTIGYDNSPIYTIVKQWLTEKLNRIANQYSKPIQKQGIGGSDRDWWQIDQAYTRRRRNDIDKRRQDNYEGKKCPMI